MKKNLIRIDEHYTIDSSDKHNNTLRYKGDLVTQTVAGTVRSYHPKDSWFYPNVKMALKAYLQRCEREATSIEDLVRRIELAEENVERFCNENGVE
jgi:hypothetical protein